MTEGYLLKTKEEIEEIDRQAEKIQRQYDKDEKETWRTFVLSTKEESEIYDKLLKPALERWQAFSKPHHEILQKQQMSNRRKRQLALGELFKDWRKCPNCGAVASRFDTFCPNEKCELNLLL